MEVDVRTDIEIARPRAEVAAFAAEPDNVTRWYANIEAVAWLTPRPLARGTRLEFAAGFRGVAAPVMSAAVRRANRKDLELLKRVLEDA